MDLWIPLAISIIIFVYVVHKFQYSYISINGEGISYKKIIGREQYVSYVDIVEYRLKPYSDYLVLSTVAGKRIVIRPVRMSLQQLLFQMSFRVTEDRWPLLESKEDRQKLEESIETNSGVLYLLDHPRGKLT